MKKLISIVSPCYNESQNVPLIVEEVKEVLKDLKNYDFEYILVNDGSNDDTWEAISKATKNDNRIKGINLSRNFGHQLALTAGLDSASGDLIIFCDSDLQHPPQVFLQLIQKWEEGYEVVHTRRVATQGISFSKKLFSTLFYKIINILTKEGFVQEGMADFKLIDRRVLSEFRKFREHNRFIRGIIPWLGFKSTIVEFEARARIHGKPWYSFRRNLTFAKKAILSFSVQPLRYIGYLGLFVSLLSVMMIALNLGWFIIYKTWLFSFMFFISLINSFLIGLVILSIGVLALYLNFIYDEVLNRPLYIISEKRNLK